MTKLLLMSFVFLLISCNNPECVDQSSTGSSSSAACPAPAPSPEPSPDPAPSPVPDPGGALPPEVYLFNASIKTTNFERLDEEKLEKAIEIIKKVISTEEFRDKVLAYSFQGKNQFVDNMGLSNGEIYQRLLDGRETLKPELDHEMDLELELYYSIRNVVGYTYPNTSKIYMNTKYFDPFTPSEVAGNVFHEWTHKLGFTHDSSYSVSRDSSVPYALGKLIRQIGAKYE